MKALIAFLLTVWLAGGGAAQEPEEPQSQDQQSKQEAPAQPQPPAPVEARPKGAPGPGDGTAQFENLNPNSSTEAPLILSDTQGFDFGPYLGRIVYIVRRNWYAEIPESARLGEKGRVAIVFEILKDGSVPQLRVVASSGSDRLDRATVAGIHDSIPFPPLPQEFTGNHLVLEFIFLYNLGSGRGSAEGSKEARWSGMIVRSDKEASTLTVRRRGTTLEKIIRYDSSTKWTTQEGKEVRPIEMSEVKDGERVICLGSYDEKGEFHATRIDLRKAGGNYVGPTAISRPFPDYTRKARKAKVEGIVAVRFTVDAQGKVSDIQVTKSLGLGLDEKTVQAVSKWKFHPATRDGVPVPAPMSVAFRFGPSYRTPQEDAQAFSAAGFRSAEPAAEAGPTSAPAPQNPPAPAGTDGKDFGKGPYAVGGNVSAPVPIHQPMPAYSKEARNAKLEGTVVLWIVVNADGSVSDVRVIKPLGKGLDEKAVETVKTWKFTPGMRNGVPVPVLMSVEVLFRLI
jgi:TonB family protein